MGVDISTYRCRVGQFAPHHGAGGMCLALDYSLLVKIIGAVVFIRILLVMAGIEQNPGPQEKFVFRYQYLLIDIGARILREIFEAKVGRDFVTYLATNNAASKTLRSLMTGKNRKITTDQEKLLPPIEMHPTSSSFDITLLSLLLRNVCGLSPAGDNVWINPPATDHTLEADITRLRKCRNEVMHTDTVRISAKELNDKWLYLDEILNRLNTTAGIANLSKLINDATHMDIDEELKERYIETIKAWVTLDCSLDEAKEDISLLKRNQSELDTRVGAVEEQHAKRQRAYDFKDIQKDLIELYKRQCNTLPVSPLFDDKDENILKIYKRPTMCSVDNRKKKNKELTSFEEMFCKDDKSCNQIYITGDAGMGKTSLCIFMCSLWSKGKLREKLDDKHKKDVEYMSKFDIVFYLNLRDTEKHGVIDIIKEQYLSHHDPLMIQDLLRKQRCLILMDGLDEWQPKQDGKKKYKLPERLYSDNCVYITTSRPYRIESERLPRRDVDHHIQITGIHGNASKSYVRDVIQYINEENSTISGVDQFVEDIDECGLGDQYDIQYTKREVSAFYRVINECDVHDQLCIPMVASQLVVLWFDGKLTNTPMALIYANILEMLFRRAEKKRR